MTDKKLLVLYAGSRSLEKEAEKLGITCFSVDITPYPGIDLVKDIEFLMPEDIPFIPDAIWAGIPCTSWSIAGISHHRYHDLSPKSDFAAKSDRLLDHTLWLFDYYEKINPNLDWFMENPRGCLRKMPQMMGLPRNCITYCSYSDTRMKPTDIWSNNLWNPLFNPYGWKSRPMCFNGNRKCQHEAAPRGSRTGTQGLKNDHERSKMPPELCREVIEHLIKTKE